MEKEQNAPKFKSVVRKYSPGYLSQPCTVNSQSKLISILQSMIRSTPSYAK